MVRYYIYLYYQVMGVPYFFRWLLEQYKKNNIISRDMNRTVDILYLDANCLFHPQCFKILGFIEEPTDKDVLEKIMIKRIILYISYLISKVNPKEVFIAVDGVAPLAKINQQRKRRFKSYKDEQIKNEIKKKYNKQTINEWSNSAITPGTEFMEKLHQQLIIFCNKLKIKHIYSSYHTPGEGEHKILEHIRGINDNNKTYVIYGLDADLIFLAMASQMDNIYLLREEIHFGKSVSNDIIDIEDVAETMVYVSIAKTKDSLYQQMESIIEEKDKCDMNKKSMVNDFIVLCFLLGNDFLPHFPSIDIRKNGLDILLDKYAETYIQLKMNLMDNYMINQIFLERLLSKLADIENDIFYDMVSAKKRERRCFLSDPYEIEIWKLENLVGIKINDPIKLGVGMPDEWRYRYYEHYYKIAGDQQAHIDKLCRTYLEGMTWTLLYYFKGCPAWRWQYPYITTPFVSDLHKYLKTHDIPDKFVLDRPLRPCTQLLTVLPPQMNHLLPVKYRDMVTKLSPIVDMFPSELELDMINKTMYWMCEPFLPMIDDKRIEKTLDAIELSKKEQTLDKVE